MTETLDKLYLEWSQYTTAKTYRDIANEKRIAELENRLRKNWKPYAEMEAAQKRIAELEAVIDRVKALPPKFSHSDLAPYGGYFANELQAALEQTDE